MWYSEIDGLQPGVVPFQPFAFLESREQEFLGHPIDPVPTAPEIDGQIVQRLLPFVQKPDRFLILVAMLPRRRKVQTLHVHRGNLAPVPQFDDPIVALVSANGFGGFDRVGQFELRRLPLLDQIQHQGRRANLQRRGKLAHVGVADDHVKPPVLFGIRMRFVTGIHQGPAVHRIDGTQHTEEIGSLRDLKHSGLPGGAFPSIPIFPAPAKICRVTRNGMTSVTIRSQATSRRMR